MSKDQMVVYPIVITPTHESKMPYVVHVPAINRDTEGRSIADAMAMAQDLIGSYSLDNQMPASETALPQTKHGEVVTLVSVNISQYRRKFDKRVVKKTLTIPSYLNEEAKGAHINFSATLMRALEKELGR